MTGCLGVSADLKPQLSLVYVILFMSIVFNMSDRSENQKLLRISKKRKE